MSLVKKPQATLLLIIYAIIRIFATTIYRHFLFEHLHIENVATIQKMIEVYFLVNIITLKIFHSTRFL